MTEKDILGLKEKIRNGLEAQGEHRTITKLSEYLLENGVILPPCSIGDTVYRIARVGKKLEVLPREVSHMTCRFNHFGDIVWEVFTTAPDILGKTVFLTREDAEAAIEERNKK